MPPGVRRSSLRPHLAFRTDDLLYRVGRLRNEWDVVARLQPACWVSSVMGLVSVLWRMGLLDASVVCASILVLALRSASAPPHHNTNFQWLGHALLFFSNSKHLSLSSSCHILRLQFLHHFPLGQFPPPVSPPLQLLFVQHVTFFTR